MAASDIRTILLVEDEPLVSLMQVETLQREGYRVIAASSGEEAVEIVRAGIEIHLILMDIDLGLGIDGTRTAETILSDHDIPVVFVSGHTEEESIRKVERIASYGYVVKGSPSTVLIASIKMAFKLHDAHRGLKEKEQVIRESEEKYRKLVEQSHDGIYIYSGNRFVFVNNRVSEITGFSEDELLAMRFLSLVHPDDRGYVQEIADKRARGETVPLTYEARIVRKDGEVRDLELAVSSINYEGRYAALGAARDITERKQAEEKVAKALDFYLTLLEDFPALIWRSGRDGRCDYFNKTWLAFTGRTLEQEVGDGWAEGVHPDDLDKCLSTYLTAFNDRKPFEMEYRLLRYDNEYRWINDIGRPFHELEGNFGGYLGSCYDITERKRAEAEIQASLKEKEVLLREIHHRVKNNLAVIASILSLQSNVTTDRKTKEILWECENRAQTMAMIHTHLYQSADLARINFKKYVRTLADAVFKSYRLNPDQVVMNINAGDVSLDINSAIPLGLILNELISNAMKYAFPDGIKGEITIDLADSADGVVLKVKDNGVGFPENLDFRNTESLGLQLVATLVEQLEGTMELTRDRGTTFTVTVRPSCPPP